MSERRRIASVIASCRHRRGRGDEVVIDAVDFRKAGRCVLLQDVVQVDAQLGKQAFHVDLNLARERTDHVLARLRVVGGGLVPHHDRRYSHGGARARTGCAQLCTNAGTLQGDGLEQFLRK